MIDIDIRSPIWSKKAVGVAVWKIRDDLRIRILHRDKKGELSYPGMYYVVKDKALNYPTMMLKGQQLKIIPIMEMEWQP